MNNKPEVTKLSKYNASVWSNTFDTFKVTVYFPENEYNDIVINYGFWHRIFLFLHHLILHTKKPLPLPWKKALMLSPKNMQLR